MHHFLLIYDLSPDYLERRGAYRSVHLELAGRFVADGSLVLGGALADPADRAILLFRADSEAVPEAFAKADPYVAEGLVRSWSVRRWVTVVGPEALTKV